MELSFRLQQFTAWLFFVLFPVVTLQLSDAAASILPRPSNLSGSSSSRNMPVSAQNSSVTTDPSFDMLMECVNLNEGHPIPQTSDCGVAIFQIPEDFAAHTFTAGSEPSTWEFRKCVVQVDFHPAATVGQVTYSWAQVRQNAGLLAGMCNEAGVTGPQGPLRTGGYARVGPNGELLIKISKEPDSASNLNVTTNNTATSKY